MKTNWQYPEPRKGLLGAFDKFVGPGATSTEIILQLGIPFIVLITAPLYAAAISVEWSFMQYCLCGLLAFDIAGGVITNSTSSAKRWYHRKEQTFSKHFSFVVLHLFHLLLVSWVYLSLDLLWVGYSGGYLLVAAIIILLVPQYLQRTISLLFYAIAVLLVLYAFETPYGLEWFLPLFYLKLLVSHLVKEEPYRP
ncbi:hypothetical protein [Marinomonas transparens]|uniref:Uncharacterized protein n=1 Tax=Marinomonas transparens TaxID=2795388 RepID=A0A934N2F9_9GAMM|nr:hypothetical protein [Marinomonas transparens]MBJ7538717.1 hypothetical protein [Marinomonas transparens]